MFGVSEIQGCTAWNETDVKGRRGDYRVTQRLISKVHSRVFLLTGRELQALYRYFGDSVMYLLGAMTPRGTWMWNSPLSKLMLSWERENLTKQKR